MFDSRRRAIVVSLALLLLPLAGCQLTPPPPPVLEPASADVLRQTVYYLASDELEGRGIATPGLEAAAQYITGYFRGLELQPPPHQDDFVQAFTADAITGLEQRTALRTSAGSFRLAADFTPLACSDEGGFADAPIAFVGYAWRGEIEQRGTGAATAPAQSAIYDDFAGIDLRGKVALAMLSYPHDPKSRLTVKNVPPADKMLLLKAQLAAEHGAVALLLVYPPDFRGRETLAPFGPYIGQRPAIPVIHITRAAAGRILREARAPTLQRLQAAIDADFVPRPFLLKRTSLSGEVAFHRTEAHLKNITACIRGRGPLADQYIVIGAHYDHLGHGPFASLAPTTRAIHPGADDNASGSAALLELARLFAQAHRPARSLLFVAFSGEEEGMLGSRYWVRHPPVPLDKIVAMVNLDMVGRINGNTLFVGGEDTASVFPSLIQQARQPSPLKLDPLWNDGEAPSDSMSFVDRHIPVLVFFSGMHADYHRPSDTPDKLNYSGEASVLNLVGRVVGQMTTEKSLSLQRRSDAAAKR
jgi:hypothetical protein